MQENSILYDRAAKSSWAYIHFNRGKVLCMSLDSEKVVLVEPDGGYFYPYNEVIEPVAMPGTTGLAAALLGLEEEALQKLEAFCSQPRTMQEIESEFDEVEAWRLRKLGILKDVGKQGRRILSQWAGYSMHDLLQVVFESSSRGTREVNS